MLTILVVDEPQIGFDFQKRLRGRGVEVVNVSSAKTAVDMIRHLNPSVIILGYELAEEESEEAYRRIKSALPRSIPVIVLYDPTRAESGLVLEAACDEALVKPVGTDVLMQKISERLKIPFLRNDRIPITLGVKWVHHRRRLSGYARNISKGGIFIETNQHLDKGSQIALSFALSEQDQPLKVQGRVIHCMELKREFRFGMGVQFVNVKPKVHDQIFQFLAQKSLQPQV